MERLSRVWGLASVCALAVAAVGCESMGTAAQSKQTQGALLGGALGAASGAIIGNQTGHAGAGTAVGAGLGALAGAVFGNALEEQQYARQTPGASVAQAYLPKFCPVGGERYSEDVKYCPIHGVELRSQTQ